MWGALTPGEIRGTAAELLDDERLSKDFSQLIDLRELTSVAAIGAQDIRAIAASALDVSSRRAFVAPDSATFGLARMFAAIRNSRESTEQVGVFRTMTEAERWLGLTTV
jgi:hypothetical protein